MVHQAESGIVRVNFRDDLVFDAQIQFASEGKSTMHAEAVNDMLPPVVHMIEASFSEQAVQEQNEQLESFREQSPEIAQRIAEEAKKMARIFNSFVPFLKNLKAESQGKTLRVQFKQPGGDQEMLKAIVELFALGLPTQ